MDASFVTGVHGCPFTDLIVPSCKRAGKSEDLIVDVCTRLVLPTTCLLLPDEISFASLKHHQAASSMKYNPPSKVEGQVSVPSSCPFFRSLDMAFRRLALGVSALVVVAASPALQSRQLSTCKAIASAVSSASNVYYPGTYYAHCMCRVDAYTVFTLCRIDPVRPGCIALDVDKLGSSSMLSGAWNVRRR